MVTSMSSATMWHHCDVLSEQTVQLLYNGLSSTKQQWVGTTVFRGKFFKIPRASLPNSVAHRSKFSAYSN